MCNEKEAFHRGSLAIGSVFLVKSETFGDVLSNRGVAIFSGERDGFVRDGDRFFELTIGREGDG